MVLLGRVARGWCHLPRGSVSPRNSNSSRSSNNNPRSPLSSSSLNPRQLLIRFVRMLINFNLFLYLFYLYLFL